MRLEYQDNIDRYLLGRMSDEERKSFEIKCAGNQELKEQLEHTRDVRTVISERSKMLAKIQEWDDKYDAKKKVATHKTITWMYWLSGIAAIFVIGFFLYPIIRPSELDGIEELASTNQKQHNVVTNGSNVSDSCAKEKKLEHLLAKNDEKKCEKPHTVKPENEEALSFGKTGFGPASPQEQGGQESELKEIEEDCNIIKQRITQLSQQLYEGKINQDVYDSSIGLLKYQRDRLLWEKAKIFVVLGRRNEALDILKEMRQEEGMFRNKADSLYNEIK